MQTGTYISGAGHVVVIAWALVGGIFAAPPPPAVELTEVTLLSGEEFAALTNTPTETPPVAEAAQPEAPQPAEISDAPVVPTQDTAPQAPEVPQVSAPVQPDTAPDVTQIEPLPQTDVTDQAPEAPETPQAPAGATLLVDTSRPPKPRPVPRVAPTPTAQPAPEAEIADTLQEAVRPDANQPSEQVTETQDATAPEAAATEIVTEAEEPGGTRQALAPTGSPRPRSRPNRPTRATQTPAEDAPTQAPSNEDSIADAVAAAVSGAVDTPAPVPAGPPMSAGEKDSLRVAVQQCWNVGALSSEALRVTVTIAVSMSQDGKPDIGSIRQIGATGGSGAAVKQAFEAGRRAIIRCGAKGYDLPADKYAQWRDIEMVFNPEKMRIK